MTGNATALNHLHQPLVSRDLCFIKKRDLGELLFILCNFSGEPLLPGWPEKLLLSPLKQIKANKKRLSPKLVYKKGGGGGHFPCQYRPLPNYLYNGCNYCNVTKKK